MITHFDIERIVKKGCISNELDYDRALIADRKLKLLVKKSPYLKTLRYKLHDIIEKYECCEWSDVGKIDDNKLIESDKTEHITEQEKQFIENRKQAITKKIKEYNVTHEDLTTILGHKCKTHMSELMNGIKPFSLRDLIVINRLFNIEIDLLIPPFLSKQDEAKVKEAVKKLDNPKVKL